MPRLIDADELPYCEDDAYIHAYDYCYRYAIDAMPTVEAIPIEWIQNILAEIGDDSPYRPAIKWLLLKYKMERKEE